LPSLENGQVIIRKRGADRIAGGHLWVYRSDIVDASTANPGDIVTVLGDRGGLIGKAFYSSTSQIALRFLTRGNIPIDETFFNRRLDNADNLRHRAGVDPRFSRRIFSEGDLIPGLMVDRYEDRLVVQNLIQGTDRLLPFFERLLTERYHPHSILFRNDIRVRELEALPLEQKTVGDPIPETIIAIENGKQIELSLAGGQKTGSYLDQSENHQVARRYSSGRALDAFAYAGGFAIHISDVCDSVEAVDISEGAVALAKSNVTRNGLTNIQCIEANAFDLLRERSAEGVRYDTIILDPPAFAKNRESLSAAIRGYKEINNRAMRLLKRGGILITCSCSHHLNEGLFSEVLADAARDANVWIRVLERRIQAADHPVLMTVPETLYLKCFILEILS
jgi:23S rRNA (cytosine1962-C5)-methyltransferase